MEPAGLPQLEVERRRQRREEGRARTEDDPDKGRAISAKRLSRKQRKDRNLSTDEFDRINRKRTTSWKRRRTTSWCPACGRAAYFFFLPPPALVPPFGFFPPLFEPGPLSGISFSLGYRR